MAVPPERLPARNEPARGTEVAAWLLLKASPEEEHALDHLRDPACTLASGNGDVLYDGRIHSHPPRDRNRRRYHPSHSGPQSLVIGAGKERPGHPGWGRGVPSPRQSQDSAALNDLDDNDDDCDHEEDVNESSHRIGRHHSQKPEYKQDHEDGPKHVLPPGLP